MSISSTLIDGKRCWTPLRSSNGGYFENEGLQTALDLAEWLAAQSTPDRPLLPIIMQATGDGEADVTRSEVMTCDKTSDGAFIPDDKHSALQILAPLIGLYHVRGGHSAVLLRQAHDQFCGTRPRFAHFYLPAEQGRAIRLAGAEITDPVVIAAKVAPAIAETVKKQVEAGIDCVGDGEFWTARRKAALPAASLAR